MVRSGSAPKSRLSQLDSTVQGVHRTAVLLLQPTVGQDHGLDDLRTGQNELYNAALEERRGAWRWERRRVSRLDQQKTLTGWDHPILRFGVWPARGTLLRVDRAFDGFFRRLNAGQKPGYPRFKSQARWDSIEYPDAYCWKLTGQGRTGRLYLQGVGHIRYRTSKRGVPGKPKTLVVKREGRRWRAYVVYETEAPVALPSTGRSVGIDLGIEALVATSDGRLVDNERFARRTKEGLAAAQRLVAGRKRGSTRRRKAAQRVGEIKRKEARQRRDALHKLSRSLINDYDVIVHEDLKIANMVRRPKPVADGEGGYAPNGASAKAGLNREIHDAGWGILLRMVAYKAEEAGRQVIAVHPRHTSQACHVCGHVEAGNRTQAVFRCLACGHTDHADINAARNILRAGLALRHERAAA